MTKKAHTKNNTTRIVVAVTAFAMLVAACGGFDSGGDADSAATTSAALETTTTRSPDQGRGQAAGQGDGDAVEAGTGGIAQTPIPPNRDIVFTAHLEIAVTDVAAGGAEAARRIEGLGGFLFGQQTTGGNNPQSVLVFKIIPEQFQAALAQLGNIGELRSQNIAATDVTERVVDLESQIRTTAASVERLRELLTNAGSVEELAALEGELLQRETHLEQLRGSLTTLRNQVALATITLQITEARLRPGIEVSISTYPGFDDDGTSCPGRRDENTIDRGSSATMCWEITNTGDTALTDITIVDTVLGITSFDDLILVDGNPDQPLDIGQTLLLAREVEVERRIRNQTRVAAVAVSSEGTILENRTVASTTGYVLRSRDPGGIPGFGDGVRRSWRALVDFSRIVALLAGLALLWLWVPVLAYVGLRWQRRRLTSNRPPAPRPPLGAAGTPRSPSGDDPHPEARTNDPADGEEDE